MNTEEKEKDLGDESSIESIEDLFVFFKTFFQAGLKGIGVAFLVGVFTFSILDKVIDFGEYDSFTLNGIDYEKPGRNSPSEEFELYEKMQEEYFDANNISLYGRNKDSILTIMFFLAFVLMARTFFKAFSSFQTK
tara:strand:+ start:45 stop:449 length:405 start_codon:yes stop_codon:yes gene_type:complete